MSQVIIVNLTDGLGNQMFEYAAGRAISQALGGQLFLLPCGNNPHSNKDYRSILFTKARCFVSMVRPTLTYVQNGPWEAWSPSMFEGVDVLLIKKALFQYLTPLLPVLPFIRSEFIEQLESFRLNLSWKYNIKDKRRTAFLHIRRGDYLKEPDAIVLQPQYYIRGMQKAEHKSLNWYVLSNDIPWCKSQSWMQGLQLVDEPDELVTLAFMSMCEGGAIIANSTFSWWGAILSGATHVVYPTKWWGNVQTQPQIFPPNWIPMDP
jgi:hypothetical protein